MSGFCKTLAGERLSFFKTVVAFAERSTSQSKFRLIRKNYARRFLYL